MTALTNHTIDIDSVGGYGRRGSMSVWISVPHNAGRVVLFPLLAMAQYFKAVNLDKQEVVCPWCIGGSGILWEWAANPTGSIFTLLLRKSTAVEGDVEGIPACSIMGRWAGDRVVLLGEYDDSQLWHELDTYTNISREVVETWNAFIVSKTLALEYRPDCCSCGE